MSIQSEIERIEGNIADTYTELSTLGADMPTPQNSDNLARTVGTSKAVLYTEQTLTEEQQAQARANIGAISTGYAAQTEEPEDKRLLWIDPSEEPEGGEGGSGIDVTAKVGQTIVVKAVDGNGKPTEWEAVDFPEAAQPDWNAAEGEPGHVIHRTHYKEMRTLVDEDVSGEDEMYFPTPFDIIKGRSYTVIVDGVSYGLIAKTASDGEAVYYYLGSGQIFDFEDDDTETPFIIISVEDEFVMMFADGRTDTISLRVQTEVYAPLSYEYIPEQKYVVAMETSDASGSSNSLFFKTMDTTMLVKALQNDWPVWLDFSAIETTSEKVLVQGWKTHAFPLDIFVAITGAKNVQLYLFASRFDLSKENNIVVGINMSD